MKEIQALVFYVGGTVFDWQAPIREAIRAMSAARGADVDDHAFALAWRGGMFRILKAVREGALPWMNADEMHRRALHRLVDEYPSLKLSADDCDALTRIWHRLKSWPEFPGALLRLRENYTVIVLTIMSWSIAVDSSRTSGISWDGILSCEFLGHYKPDLEAYRTGVRLLGLKPDQAMMVASHTVDLKAAQGAGLRTAYVTPRSDEPEFAGFAPASPEEFDLRATDFMDLADQLCG
jgi:2-haloacid dehalogenase